MNWSIKNFGIFTFLQIIYIIPIFAMIRQLGPSTFFVIFTSGESKQIDLKKTFHELKKFHYKDIKDNKFEDEDIFKLVRGDHVTCARYYNHRMKCFRKLLSSTNTLFGQVEDIFL